VAAAGVALMVAGKAVSLFADLLGIAAAVLPLLLTPYDPKTRTRNLGTPYRFSWEIWGHHTDFPCQLGAVG
jgi:hypothetical protein